MKSNYIIKPINHMNEVADLLGVAENEVFRIKQEDAWLQFRINKNGLEAMIQGGDFGWDAFYSYGLEKLLKGEYTIVKQGD